MTDELDIHGFDAPREYQLGQRRSDPLPMDSPASCHVFPGFWVGARKFYELTFELSEPAVSRYEELMTRGGDEPGIPSREARSLTEEEQTRREQRVKDLTMLEKAAGRRDLMTVPAWHRWWCRGTTAAGNTGEEE